LIIDSYRWAREVPYNTGMENDNEKIVTLALFYSEIEAELVANTLRGEGIEAQMAGGLTGGFRAETPGRVKVLVKTSDFETAKAVMEDYFKSKENIDWSQVDVGDGSEDAPGDTPEDAADEATGEA